MTKEFTVAVPQSIYTRYFFIAMAVLFIIFAVAGFVPDYQLMAAQHIAVYWFAHVHGVIMTAWLLVYLIQAVLIRRANIKLHMNLGLASVSLGILVWISMGIVIYHANIGYPVFKNVVWPNVLLLASFMNLFALFFTWGIIVRKNAAAHKRLLYLATMIVISAGYNRILLNNGVNPTLKWLTFSSLSGLPNPSAILVYHDLLLIPLFIYDLIAIGGMHKITLIGTVFIISIQLIVLLVWRLLP
ncbi:MAG TPA: hypothetical protein VKI61_08730 [Chitinophagaceae bacterium]|nr:hypothetical protein [Chitinophagaceae bacterium]